MRLLEVSTQAVNGTFNARMAAVANSNLSMENSAQIQCTLVPAKSYVAIAHVIQDDKEIAMRLAEC